MRRTAAAAKAMVAGGFGVAHAPLGGWTTRWRRASLPCRGQVGEGPQSAVCRLRREGGRAPSMRGRSSCPERQELMPGPDALYLAPPPAEKKFRHIDIIVFNAAANTNIESILDTKESALDNLWEIIVKASILLVQEDKHKAGKKKQPLKGGASKGTEGLGL